MAFFEWQDNFNLCSPEDLLKMGLAQSTSPSKQTSLITIQLNTIDDQHKNLAHLINKLYDIRLLGTVNSNALLQKVLDELIAYTKYHFQAEEKLMMNIGFPQFQTHKNIHDIFTAKITQSLEDFKNGKTQIEESLFYFLKTWLIEHILGSDKEISTHLLKTTL